MIMVKLTLVHGDCLKVLPKIPDESIDTIIADYPFKMYSDLVKNSFHYRELEFILNLTKREQDRIFYEKFIELTSSEFYRILKPNGNLIVVNNPHNLFISAKYFEKFEFRNELTLIRPHAFYPNKMLGMKHNNAWFLCKGGKDKWNYMKMPDVIEYKNGYNGHPEALPEELVELFLKLTTNSGEVVLDPFAGSGTTLQVCRRLGINCIAIEINEDYINVIKRRLNWGSSLGDVEFKFYDERDFLWSDCNGG